MTFREIIEQIKARYDLDTDYMAIKILQVNKSTVYKALKNNSIPCDDVIYTCEKLLDYPEGYLLLEMQAERSKCPEAVAIFHRLSKQILATAATILLSISMTLGVSINDASAKNLVFSVYNNIHYAESNKAEYNLINHIN